MSLPIPKSVFGTDDEIGVEIDRERSASGAECHLERTSGAVNLMWPEEHETWYNQMLDYELSRFEVALAQSTW